MTNSMGTLDFFLIEAGEYLERLDALAQAPAGTSPAIEEFVRLSRAFRGSAIMASQHGMARAAQGLESCARALRDNRLAWSEQARGEIIRAVDDCKVLMRRLRQPDQGDTERAEAIGVRLDRMSGRASAAMRAAAVPGLDAGGRAFVAREASSIASVLQTVARNLRGNPAGRDALNAIGPAMSALRGVAVLNDLPPLGELLAAIEAAVKDTEAGAEVFDDAAKALARAAREVVDQGRPDGDSGEARAFAARLFGTLGSDVVPIESLKVDDGADQIVSRGTVPAQQSFGRVEMVSQGEYLNAAATELSKANGVQMDLRLYAIASSLRPVVNAGGAPLAAAMGQLALAVRNAIGRGAASSSLNDFLKHLRDSASALSSAGNADEGVLAAKLTAAAIGVESLGAAAQRRVTPPVAGAAPAMPAMPAMPAPVMGESDLVTSFLTLEQLINERGMPLGSLSELLGQPAATGSPQAAAGDIVPIESLAPDEGAEVPVESLLYRGEAALRRIQELKPELVAAAGTPGPKLHSLISEVLDLVELSLTR